MTNQRCPWCNAEFERYNIGKWRCPYCTGYFKVGDDNRVSRVYRRPFSPVEVTIIILGIIAIAVSVIVNAVSASEQKRQDENAWQERFDKMKQESDAEYEEMKRNMNRIKEIPL